MKEKKFTFYSLTEPLNLFYLGFLASVGLALGSVMIINLIRKLIELKWEFEILIYSRIALTIFYLFFLGYTYYLLDMKKEKALRNGFILFAILYILAQIYIWI